MTLDVSYIEQDFDYIKTPGARVPGFGTWKSWESKGQVETRDLNVVGTRVPTPTSSVHKETPFMYSRTPWVQRPLVLVFSRRTET